MQSKEHVDSVRAELNSKVCGDVSDLLSKPVELRENAMVQAFQCVYFLCKNKIAHCTNFEKLLDLVKLLGIDIKSDICKGNNAKYTSNTAIKEIVQCLSDVIEAHILSEMKSSDTYALMFDETTDCTVIEQMVIHTRFINKEGEVCVRFLKILDALSQAHVQKHDDTDSDSEKSEADVDVGLEDELDERIITLNADTISRKVTDYIEDNGLNYGKLHGIGTDGAAVLTGKLNGAVKKIIDRQVLKQTHK